MSNQDLTKNNKGSNQGDLISREALLKAMEEERQYLLARGQTGAEHILVHHCLPIIDNAPTIMTEEQVDLNEVKAIAEEAEQERQQGDLISREALKKALNYTYDCAYIDSKSKEGIVSDIIETIDNAPTVETTKVEHKAYNEGFKDGVDQGIKLSERPHGEWEILKGDYFTGGGDPVLICPFCHSEESKHMGGIEFPVNWNFCPNCGADMRGEEE